MTSSATTTPERAQETSKMVVLSEGHVLASQPTSTGCSLLDVAMVAMGSTPHRLMGLNTEIPTDSVVWKYCRTFRSLRLARSGRWEEPTGFTAWHHFLPHLRLRSCRHSHRRLLSLKLPHRDEQHPQTGSKITPVNPNLLLISI